jgi:hypothetical protein
MGTRHRQAVISKTGELKIQQYGQWDGYPSGQGIDILKYLRSGNLKKYQKNLNKINLITDDQVKKVEDDPNWTNNYPYMSRDCGSQIHQMIEDGEVPFVSFIEEDEAKKWCEGFYTIDFKNGVFISDYYGIVKAYPLDKLPTDEVYLAEMEPPEEE